MKIKKLKQLYDSILGDSLPMQESSFYLHLTGLLNEWGVNMPSKVFTKTVHPTENLVTGHKTIEIPKETRSIIAVTLEGETKPLREYNDLMELDLVDSGYVYVPYENIIYIKTKEALTKSKGVHVKYRGTLHLKDINIIEDDSLIQGLVYGVAASYLRLKSITGEIENAQRKSLDMRSMSQQHLLAYNNTSILDDYKHIFNIADNG